jgi:phosphoribosyl-ATP pyrophosphohydrolase
MADIDGTTLDRLYRVIESRKGGNGVSSYTAQLFAQGNVKIAKKLGEEAIETVIEGTRGNAQGIIAESADLLYHLLVLWAFAGVEPQDVWRALESRAGVSGIAEKKSRPPS